MQHVRIDTKASAGLMQFIMNYAADALTRGGITLSLGQQIHLERIFTHIEQTYYDGKILSFTYRGIKCRFSVYNGEYIFEFPCGTSIALYEYYTLCGGKDVLNDSEYDSDFVSLVDSVNPITTELTSCFGSKCKVVVYNTVDTMYDKSGVPREPVIVYNKPLTGDE